MRGGDSRISQDLTRHLVEGKIIFFFFKPPCHIFLHGTVRLSTAIVRQDTIGLKFFIFLFFIYSVFVLGHTQINPNIPKSTQIYPKTKKKSKDWDLVFEGYPSSPKDQFETK